MSLIGLVFQSPCISITVVYLIWAWSKFLVEEWDYRRMTLSYQDCVSKCQYWRIFTAPLSHQSTSHLLANLLTLWSCRSIERRYGSWFIFRYSALLLLCEAGLTILFIQYCMKLSRNEMVTNTLYTMSSSGISGLILAWMAYSSIDPKAEVFLFLGIIPLHPALAIIPTICFHYFLGPVSTVYSNLCGLISGYLLASGVLLCLSGGYWTFCFLVNIAILASATLLNEDTLPRNGNAVVNPPNTLELVSLTNGEDEDGSDEPQRLLAFSSASSSSTSPTTYDDQDNMQSRSSIWGSMVRSRGGAASQEGEEAEERQPLLGPMNV